MAFTYEEFHKSLADMSPKSVDVRLTLLAYCGAITVNELRAAYGLPPLGVDVGARLATPKE